MRSLVCTVPARFDYIESDLPETRNDEVLLKITHIGICGTDLHAYEGTQPYFSYPRILGHELAAVVVDPGQNVQFNNDERVTVIPYLNCGFCVACRTGKPNCCVKLNVLGVHSDGGMREYISVPASCLVRAEGMEAEHLALIEPLAIGAHGVGRAGIRAGENVLVIGAGPIGLAAMQFAAIAGGRVIAMDLNSSRLEFCETQLGTPFVINAADDDIIGRLMAVTNGEMPTVVIDATGSAGAINNAFQYLAHSGRFVLIGLQKQDVHFSHPEFHKREATLMSSRNATRQDFEFVIRMVQEGKVNPATWITHRITFPDAAEEFPKLLLPGSGVIKAVIIVD
jgi:2-desacetyl-2-hydroxyethyl bacteriochlorophyllide A dehydrogenase